MSDAAKDAIAQMAMNDLFGDTPEGQKTKQVYEQTGRLPGAQDMNERGTPHRRQDDSPGVVVVQPLDYKKLANSVSESALAESLMDDGYAEKAGAIDQVANEAKEEAAKAISKILKTLR